MPYQSDWTNPGKLLKSMGAPFWGKLKPVIGEKGGDFTCLLSLFFDNLSTLVGVSGAFLFAVCGGHPQASDIVYQRIIPALGFMLFIGNTYFSWMATRMATQYGRDFVAQPYGVNTVGAFPFIFGIMGPIITHGYSDVGHGGDYVITGDDIIKGWKAGCAGNFIVGLVGIVLGILMGIPLTANMILKVVPIAGFMIPVAGVGLTWLCLNQLAPCFGTPLAGFIPMVGMMLAYYGASTGSPPKIGKFTVPGVLMWVVPGYILGWIYGLPVAADPNYKFEHPGAGLWIGGALFEGFGELTSGSIGTILPLAITAVMGDYMALVSAQQNGDPYPIGETLVVDGITTIMAALLGSPFGTVVYFGHPVHKNIGGKYAYSFMNGVIYLILNVGGIFKLINEISPKVAVGPTIAIFGFMLSEECTRVLPQRHHWIIFFTLFFGFCDFFAGDADGSEEGTGFAIMKTGALLNCMLWSAMLVYAVDAKWLAASAVAGVCAFFSMIGLIHQPQMFEGKNGETDMTLFAEGSYPGGGNTGTGWNDGAWLGVGPRYSCSALQVMLAYLSLIIFWFLPFKFLQKYEPITTAKDAKDDDAINSKAIVLGGLDAWWAPAEGDSAVSKTDESAKTEA
jgi:AGZA family xanthine/uracil permease-like MFS transporter